MKLYIPGSYYTKFGELWELGIEELAHEAVDGALIDAQLDPTAIDAVFVANMAAAQLENQVHLGAVVAGFFPHFPPALRVEAACASGGVALVQAELAVLSGQYQTVLVLGVEKMTDAALFATAVLTSAADQKREHASTFPALYAILAKEYMSVFGDTREALTQIAIKNHAHALLNPRAQFHKALTPEMVLASPLVADPLRLLDCSPISDGAAAVIVSSKRPTKTTDRNQVIIAGFGQAQDTLDLARRRTLTSLEATTKAATKAYATAATTPQAISHAEVHDCFTHAELLAIEDLGFFSKGDGVQAILGGKTEMINPSGGLKGCGHPVGATGVKQVAYLHQQLADNRVGGPVLAHNVGGSGATAVVHILERV